MSSIRLKGRHGDFSTIDETWVLEEMRDDIALLRASWQRMFGSKQGKVRVEASYDFVGFTGEQARSDDPAGERNRRSLGFQYGLAGLSALLLALWFWTIRRHSGPDGFILASGWEMALLISVPFANLLILHVSLIRFDDRLPKGFAILFGVIPAGMTVIWLIQNGQPR